MTRISDLWQHHRKLLIAFVLAAIVTLFFLIRTVVFTVYWANPDHRDLTIEPWMTIRYVSNSWDLPREVMIEAMGFESGSGRLTFGEISKTKNIALEEMTSRIKFAATVYRAEKK